MASLDASTPTSQNPRFSQCVDGLKKYAEGDFAGAASMLSQYLAYYPEDGRALRFFGLTCRWQAARLRTQADTQSTPAKEAEAKRNQRKKLLIDAENAFGKRTRLTPDSAEAWNDLGELVFDLERFGDAHKYFQRALVKQPDYDRARVNLARLYLEAGLPIEAKAMLDAAASSLPPDAELAELRSRSFVQANRTVCQEIRRR
ncbi:MAG: tetratricopeptide repeat protein [Candidatus Lindowbacteria bacterium]|nr:tetratricopeptide repeat protein [Candidatus Lindowbacteria bacterium]